MLMKRFKICNIPVIIDTILPVFISNFRSPLLNKTSTKVTTARDVTQLLCFKALADLINRLICNFLIAVPARLFCLKIISVNAAISEIGGRRKVNTILATFMVMV